MTAALTVVVRTVIRHIRYLKGILAVDQFAW